MPRHRRAAACNARRWRPKARQRCHAWQCAEPELQRRRSARAGESGWKLRRSTGHVRVGRDRRAPMSTDQTLGRRQVSSVPGAMAQADDQHNSRTGDFAPPHRSAASVAARAPAAARAAPSKLSQRPARKSRERCKRASRPTVPGSRARWRRKRGASRNSFQARVC